MNQTRYRRTPACRRKRRCRGKNVWLTVWITVVLLIGTAAGGKLISYIGSEKAWSIGGRGSEDNIFGSTGNINLNHLYSRYAILIDADSGEVIAHRNSGDKIYPASMTKIMTAILAIENSDDLGERVTVPPDIFPALYGEGASLAGFEPGEEVTLRELLYGILLPSGAESCVTFAERIAGSEEEFVDLMNEKAKELGMDHTHFRNCTGLHNAKHYSTASDIAVLLRYALKNPDFREAFCSSRYSTGPSLQHPDGFTVYSTMFQKLENAKVTGGEILGGKTGYTEEGGLCLASLANVNGREYILVTAKADGNHQTEPFHVLDAVDVYEQIGKSEDGNNGL
ncbi:D-alanyl-D-alanine carboxypeptidase [Roseburia hominis]